jgi:periplasmic divalent cation tolerance protein
MPSPSAYAVVQTTTDSREHADELAAKLVEARLAACVHVLPVTSHYRWKGELRREQEFLLSAKTRRALFERVADFIKANHHYETPEIVLLPIEAGSPDYLRWIDAETDALQ